MVDYRRNKAKLEAINKEGENIAQMIIPAYRGIMPARQAADSLELVCNLC